MYNNCLCNILGNHRKKDNKGQCVQDDFEEGHEGEDDTQDKKQQIREGHYLFPSAHFISQFLVLQHSLHKRDIAIL